MRGVKRHALSVAWRALPPALKRLAPRVFAQSVTLGVAAVIEDERGRVLLARHTYRARPWGLPGGFVKRGEEAPAALARELREELGVPVRVGPLLAAAASAPGHHLTLFYRVTLLGAPQVDAVEVDHLRYAPRDEVARLLGAHAAPWIGALDTSARGGGG